MKIKVPLHKVSLVGKELAYVSQAIRSGRLSGDGAFTRLCPGSMEKSFRAKKILLTTSGTHALEMAAMLAGVGPDTEVIMPSFTFVSTANAFVSQGGRPVFVDIKPDTLNINEDRIEERISSRTRAIVPVHYAGVSCDMKSILRIARYHKLAVIEDAAQAVHSLYQKKYLGTIGDLGCLSFHETKNFICGEGGALILNREKYFRRSEIIREKGTNRSQFLRKEVSKYTWVDKGSSYLISEILAAFLYGQLKGHKKILAKRKKLFNRYEKGFRGLEVAGEIRLPVIPGGCVPNYHIFYILLNRKKERDTLIAYLKRRGIQSAFHFVPLHYSPMGRSFGYKKGQFPVTEDVSLRILRLPLYFDMSYSKQDYVIKSLYNFLGKR